MITPSLAAYCISLHPEVWQEIVPDGDPCKLGATYRQRAERYISELALNYTDYKDHKLFNFQPISYGITTPLFTKTTTGT